MQERSDPKDLLSSAYRVILALGVVCVALILAVSYLALRPHRDSGSAPAVVADPAIREQVVAQLVEESQGLFDAHVDPEVGRVQLPNLSRQVGGIEFSINRFGMRERNWEVPKPADVVRIVILGDSFVFGYGVAAEQRMGARLEHWLGERATDFNGRIECLHLGVPSWNYHSTTAFLRRQLSDLAPDLVFHIALPNDVEDTVGVRGFGVMARFSPQHRQRADSWISAGFPIRDLGFAQHGHVRQGIDFEGRERYRAAGLALRRLSSRLTDAGVPYRLLFHYRNLLTVPRHLLEEHLDPGQTVYLASAFGNDRNLWNSAQDYHWNAAGHERVAELLYGLILRDRLLPQLELEPSAEASTAVEQIAVAGRAEAEREAGPVDIPRRRGFSPVASAIDLTDLDEHTAAQIHGGIDREGLVSPYASVILSNNGARILRLQGSALDRPELEGARVQVWVDDVHLGELELQTGAQIDQRFSLPAGLDSRPFLSIRLQATDYAYQGRDYQHCVVFRLRRLTLSAK